jgi:hypothetical protein
MAPIVSDVQYTTWEWHTYTGARVILGDTDTRIVRYTAK